jgi:hypothetical protein
MMMMVTVMLRGKPHSTKKYTGACVTRQAENNVQRLAAQAIPSGSLSCPVEMLLTIFRAATSTTVTSSSRISATRRRRLDGKREIAQLSLREAPPTA